MRLIAFFVVLVAALAAADSIPGLDQGFGAGFDIRDELVRMPIFAPFHYTYGQTFKNPYTGVVYDIPDEMYLTEINKGKVVKTFDFYQDWHSYEHSVQTSFGVDAGLNLGTGKAVGKLAFRHSKAETHGYMKNGTNEIAVENRYNPLYQLDLWPDTKVNPHFAHMVDTLPEAINTPEDKEKYQDFILAVGTHYLSTAQFGGFVNITCVFASELFNSYSREWVQNQVSLSITWEEINLGIDVSRNSSTKKQDGHFKVHSYNVTEHDGGDQSVLANKGYDAWLTTVYELPGVLPAYRRLFPITDLIKDANKKKNLLAEIVDYLEKPSPYDIEPLV
eukprot:GCRY01000166.1.p1 GENE.GCRY01000166.1~~GCRY01000166.1.p1  ORF type:complete len:347 (-),score=70.40 GCRY01000166.1:226-1224(-)